MKHIILSFLVFSFALILGTQSAVAAYDSSGPLRIDVQPKNRMYSGSPVPYGGVVGITWDIKGGGVLNSPLTCDLTRSTQDIQGETVSKILIRDLLPQSEASQTTGYTFNTGETDPNLSHGFTFTITCTLLDGTRAAGSTIIDVVRPSLTTESEPGKDIPPALSEPASRPVVKVLVSEQKTINTTRGDTVTVTWSAENAEYCSPYGDWGYQDGSKQETNGSQSINTGDVRYVSKDKLTFIMRCTGSGGTGSSYARVELLPGVITGKPSFFYPQNGAYIGQNGVSPVSSVTVAGQTVDPNDTALIADKGSNNSWSVEISIDNGSWQAMTTDDQRFFRFETPETLTEGAHIWKLRYRDGDRVGQATAPRSFIVDNTPPTGSFQVVYSSDKPVAVWQNYALQSPRIRKNAVYFNHNFTDSLSGLDGVFSISRSINNGSFTTVLNDLLAVKSFDEILPQYLTDDGTIQGNTDIQYRVSVRDNVGNSTTTITGLHTPLSPVPPSGTTDISVTVTDEDNNFIPGTTVTIQPGNTSILNGKSNAYPINQGHPYALVVTVPESYSLSPVSPDGQRTKNGARVDYQISNEPNTVEGLHTGCSSNQERCKQVLNHRLHNDIQRSAKPDGYNKFLVLDQPDDAFTFIFKRSEVLKPVLTSFSVLPSRVKSNEKVTVSWKGENLDAFCHTSSVKNDTGPDLSLWSGNAIASKSDGTGGAVVITAPTVSEPTIYRLGIRCGDTLETEIDPLRNELRAPILTVEPLRSTTGESVTVIPEAPSISGRVYDPNGKGVQTKIVINNRQYDTLANGVFSIPHIVHAIPYAGTYQISAVTPPGYQSSRAVNSQINGRGAAYRYQVLGTTCRTNDECKTLFNRFGRQGDPVNSRIHDLNVDGSFEFELSPNPAPTTLPALPELSETPGNPPRETPNGETDNQLPAPVSITTFLASMTLVDPGDEISIEWDTSGDATVCIASSSDNSSVWNGVKFTSGVENGIVVNRSSTFDITCSGPGGEDYRFVEVQTREDKPITDIQTNPGSTGDVPPVDTSIPPTSGHSCNPATAVDTYSSCPAGFSGQISRRCLLNNGVHEWVEENNCTAIAPTLSCNTGTNTAKNVIKGASINILDIVDCRASDGSSVSYRVDAPDQSAVSVNNNRFTPETSGSYRITTISDALSEHIEDITINVFDPDVQEVSP